MAPYKRDFNNQQVIIAVTAVQFLGYSVIFLCFFYIIWRSCKREDDTPASSIRSTIQGTESALSRPGIVCISGDYAIPSTSSQMLKYTQPKAPLYHVNHLSLKK
ncbi:unnamed protein product [Calicophoron daubneyi]|uniref:ATP synthase F0 subunit 8 n=1 Tax=Calicophoron daubneyi TaxID=300641 RepID=A0AAV2T2A5_CALDB